MLLELMKCPLCLPLRLFLVFELLLSFGTTSWVTHQLAPLHQFFTNSTFLFPPTILFHPTQLVTQLKLILFPIFPPLPALSFFSINFYGCMGPNHTTFSNGSHYFLSIVDYHSKYLWFFPLQLKSNVSSIVLAFHKYVETQFSIKVLSIKTDGGEEYKSLSFIFYNLGIMHQLTCP